VVRSGNAAEAGLDRAAAAGLHWHAPAVQVLHQQPDRAPALPGPATAALGC
jgi:hypothetical protein